MNFFSSLIIFVVSFLCVSCSTYREEIIAVSDITRPDWANTTTTNFILRNRLNFVGMVEASANQNVSMLCMAAENIAKKHYSDYLQQSSQHLTSVSSLPNENVSVRYLGKEKSEMSDVEDIKSEGCCWEKILIWNDTDSKKLIYRVFSRISVPIK